MIKENNKVKTHDFAKNSAPYPAHCSSKVPFQYYAINGELQSPKKIAHQVSN